MLRIVCLYETQPEPMRRPCRRGSFGGRPVRQLLFLPEALRTYPIFSMSHTANRLLLAVASIWWGFWFG